jgi:hypothetical protein
VNLKKLRVRPNASLVFQIVKSVSLLFILPTRSLLLPPTIHISFPSLTDASWWSSAASTLDGMTSWVERSSTVVPASSRSSRGSRRLRRRWARVGGVSTGSGELAQELASSPPAVSRGCCLRCFRLHRVARAVAGSGEE